MKDYWDKVYASKPVTRLGWYEPVPTPSLELIAKCGLDPQDAILDVGSGASTLISALLDLEYQYIYALDISEIAFQKAKAELGDQKAARIQWIVEDVLNPSPALDLPDIALWHDRAVFHFFTDDEQRRNYFSTLKRVLRPGGYAMIAAFAIGGAEKCSGLDVRNYDKAGLVQFMGADFKLMESLDYRYQMPSGDFRPYVYTLFQRIG